VRGTWQTDGGSSGSGLGTVVLVIVAAALLGPAVVSAATAVAVAVAELVRIVLITVAVLAGLGAAGLVALAAVRVHRWRTGGTTRVSSLPAPPPWRAVQATTEPRRAIEAPRQVHIHLHGVSAEDVAELVRRQQEARINRPGFPSRP
jgi:hypothetical protein